MDRDLAESAVRQAKTDPHRAIEMVAPLLSGPDNQLDAEVEALARWARGRGLYELAKNDDAVSELTRARDLAPSQILKDRIDISLAAAVSAAGDHDAAQAMLTEIAMRTDPVVAALARSQLALFALGKGNLAEAAEDLQNSIQPLEQSENDGDAAARALGNLAYCEMTLGRLDQAEASYQRAVEFGTRFDEGLVVAGCLQNLGYLAMRRGHLGEAIKRLAEAEAGYRSIKGPGRNLSTLYDDMAETHRIAGLTNQAVQYATAALNSVKEGGNAEKIAEARYRLATCALDDQDLETAKTQSRLAAEAFRSAGRSIWVHRAQSLLLDALGQTEVPDADTIALAHQAAGELEAAGWAGDALRIRNRLAASLLQNDQPGFERFLAPGVAKSDQSIGTKLERIFASALLKRSEGSEVLPDLQQANALIVRHQQHLGDPELRAGAARLAQRFRVLDHDQATKEHAPANHPEQVLLAEERWRALSFDLPRATPPADPDLARMSEQLRHAAATLRDAERWDQKTASEVRKLERQIRSRSLQSTAAQPGQNDTVGTLSMTMLTELLDGRYFLEWIEVKNELLAVLVSAEGIDLWQCGPVAPLLDSAETIMATMGRLLRPGLDSSGQDRLWKALMSDCKDLAAHLLNRSPFDRDDEVVLAPPPALGMLPWPLILDSPSRPVSITPSATAWIRRRTASVGQAVGIAVGPDLNYGESDIERIRTTFAHATVLEGADATTTAVRDLMQSSQIVHVAAHGSFRSDSPGFSTLALNDGPLALYELENDASVAPLVVLAACDAGRTADRAGNELLGFAPTLLNAGAANIIAPTMPVLDSDVSEFLGAFYANLPGNRPSTALAMARTAYGQGSIGQRVLACALVCFGGDCGRVSNDTV